MPLDFGRKKENNKELSETEMPLEQKKVKRERKKLEFTIDLPKYSFEDIILSEQQTRDLRIAISYYEHRNLLMEDWGLKKLYPERKGLLINLYGESGTGKTMSAHAIAKELDKRLVLVNYAEIESKYVGETSKNLVDLFRFAEENDTVILFDEADALLSRRVTNMSSSTDVSVNQTKSVLLNILNDYSGVVIFTTNFISNYDYAFVRRILFQIRFGLPDKEQRKRIWEVYLSTGIPHYLDIDELVESFDGISGSDIASAVWMAALETAECGEKYLQMERMKNAVQKIIRAKADNQGIKTDNAEVISTREVSEEYALEQIKKGEKKIC